jgi:short-subunit dehydrogenase
MNGTALITGASSGLGLEFARQLDGRVSHFILVARRGEKLQALAASLSTPSTIIEQDLSLADSPEALCERIEGQQITVEEVNNTAGFPEPH